MIVLDHVSAEELALFGEEGQPRTWRSPVKAISKGTIYLYQAHMDRLLRQDLGCEVFFPPEAHVVEQVKRDVTAFRADLEQAVWSNDKIYLIRELFVLRDAFEAMQDTEFVGVIDRDFLQGLNRSIFEKMRENVTASLVMEELTNNDSPFETYGMLRTFIQWRRLTARRIELALGDLSELDTECRAYRDRVLQDLGKNNDLASLILSHHVRVVEGMKRDKAFAILLADMEKRFHAHVDRLVSARDIRGLLRLFPKKAVREKVRPDITDLTVANALEVVRKADPDKKILGEELDTLAAFQEREQGLLDDAQSWVRDLKPDKALAALATLRAQTSTLTLRPAGKIADIEEQAHRLKAVLEKLQAFEARVNDFKEKGRLADAWQEVNRLHIQTVAVDIAAIQERWRRELIAMAQADADRRIAARTVEIAKLLGADRIIEAGKLAERSVFDSEGPPPLPPGYDVQTVRQRLSEPVQQRLRQVLDEATSLEQARRLPELLLHCERYVGIPDIDATGSSLRARLKTEVSCEVVLDGKKMRWYPKSDIRIQRGDENSDFYITLSVISRVPIRIGVKNGIGYLEVQANLTNPIWIGQGSGRVEVVPGRRATLPSGTKIVFAYHFPLHCTLHHGRFLRLCFEEPDDPADVQHTWGRTVEQLWPDRVWETRLPILVGI